MIWKGSMKGITSGIVAVSLAIFVLAYLVKYRNRIRVNCANGSNGLFEGSMKLVKENVGVTVDESKSAVQKYVTVFKNQIKAVKEARKERSEEMSGTEKEEEPAANEEETTTAAQEGDSKSLYVAPASPTPSTNAEGAKSSGSTKSWRDNNPKFDSFGNVVPEFDCYGNPIDENGGVMA